MFMLCARSAGLLALGSIAGLLINTAHPRGVSLTAPSGAVACSQPNSVPAVGLTGSSSLALLSPAQVAHLCSDAQTLVVDARTAEEFAHGHVAGAIHLSCRSSRDAADTVMGLMAGKNQLVVYGNDTDDARPVADEIRARGGMSNLKVAVLVGGFAAWNREGLACSSGPCPECTGAERAH